MPKRKRRSPAVLKKEKIKPTEAEVIKDIEESIKKGDSIPLEDMPLSMRRAQEALEEKDDKDDSHIPSGFDAAEPVEKVVDLGPPKHYGCGAALQSQGSDGVGVWWECAGCRSQFYNKSRVNKGYIGDPRKADVMYKIDNRSKRGRRLT